jgi:hypothetical protein
MTKYHPGDKVTVRATVAYNCMSPKLVGVSFRDNDDYKGITVVVSTSDIVSHEKVPLRQGDKVKSVDGIDRTEYTVLEVYEDYAWVKSENSSPMTFCLHNLERV